MSTFRTFRAPDTRSALAMVKAALGSDAIIVATREVENGLFRPKEIEVTAARPEPVAPTRPPQATAYAPPNLKPKTELSEALQALTARKDEPARPAAPAPRTLEPRDELNSLRTSLEEVRREVRRMSGHVRLERELQLPPPAAELLSVLLQRGVEDALAERCVRDALESSQHHNSASLQTALRHALHERVSAGPAPWNAHAGHRVMALVGPTGVGKTTSLAKIAARTVMEGRKVALITVDTYRIGASEQLTRYGEIMGAPTFVARDRVELARAIEKCGRADLVLVDTAGRSVSEAVARQAEMLRSIEGISLCLTLSACTGPREMAAAADRYRALNPEHLLITKVDEAIGPGSLLSASTRIGRPVVAVCDGQRVPEDIHSLSAADLVELVLEPAHSGLAAGAR